MDNNIILNNITQEEITIDLISVPVIDAFKGFYCLSQGVHYISVVTESGKQVGFWCYFEGEEEVIARSFNSEKQIFEEWVGEEAEHYKKLALAEEMDDELIAYPSEAIDLWTSLAFYIQKLGPPSSLNTSVNNQTFTELLEVIHKGDISKLLAEFQFAFIRMAIQAIGEKDEEAVERWKEMMRIIYNATEDDIKENGLFFIKWINVLFDQFETLPDRSFQRTGEATTYQVIVKNAGSLCERLIKSGDDETMLSGKRLKLYLEQRGAQL